jgi:succinate-acetate transporter protein
MVAHRTSVLAMTRRAAAFLYLFAGWTVFVWVVFIKNILPAHQFSTGFKVVHISLAIISLALAAGAFAVVRGVRHARPEREKVGAHR